VLPHEQVHLDFVTEHARSPFEGQRCDSFVKFSGPAVVTILAPVGGGG
jgi:hypothetical protein